MVSSLRQRIEDASGVSVALARIRTPSCPKCDTVLSNDAIRASRYCASLREQLAAKFASMRQLAREELFVALVALGRVEHGPVLVIISTV